MKFTFDYFDSDSALLDISDYVTPSNPPLNHTRASNEFRVKVYATMCLFGYYTYEDCGHKEIEIVSHCVGCLWKAGMDGQLWACPEVQYIKHLMELAPLTWEGKCGYCKSCQKTYAVGPSFLCF